MRILNILGFLEISLSDWQYAFKFYNIFIQNFIFLKWFVKNCCSAWNYATILDINFVHFLQFKRNFIPQAELEEAFHKPIDFSIDLRILGHMVIGLKQVRVPIGHSHNTKNNLLSLSELADNTYIVHLNGEAAYKILSLSGTVVNFMNFSPIRSKTKFCLYIFNKKVLSHVLWWK